MKTVAFIILFFIPATFFAQTAKPAPEFNGVKVDSTLDYCVKQYVAKGFTLDKKEGAMLLCMESWAQMI